MKEQVSKLGPEGLAKLEKALEDAKAEHERPIPEKVLTDFPVPDVKSISWISVQSAKAAVDEATARSPVPSDSLQKYVDGDTAEFGLPIHFDHVAVSQFPFNKNVTDMPQVRLRHN